MSMLLFENNKSRVGSELVQQTGMLCFGIIFLGSKTVDLLKINSHEKA